MYRRSRYIELCCARIITFQPIIGEVKFGVEFKLDMCQLADFILGKIDIERYGGNLNGSMKQAQWMPWIMFAELAAVLERLL